MNILLSYLEEDAFGSYARQLSKYFLAEGIVSSHAIFLASAEPEPDSILKVQIKIIHITAAIRDKMNKFGFQALGDEKAKRRFQCFCQKALTH